MPNRILKEGIRTSKSVNALTDFQFRVWSYLITYVDDYGRGSADPEILKGMVFTRRKSVTETQIEKALADLANIGMVNLYEVGGEPFFCFPNWSEHQVVRNKKSKFPAPEEGKALDNKLKAIESNCNQLNANVSVIQSNTNTNPNTNTKRKSTFVPPTLKEVEDYCRERGNKVDPKRFFEFFNEAGWVDSKGNAVRSWKQKVITWEGYANSAKPVEAKRQSTYDLDEFEKLLEGSFP